MATEEAALLPASWNTSWGWALAGVVLQKNGRARPGGFEAVYKQIARSGVGKSLGVQNTYKKLFEYPAPPDDGKDIARAAVLLLVVNEDPADPKWGLDLKQVPAIYGTLKRLRDLLAAKGGPMPPSIWTVPSPVAA